METQNHIAKAEMNIKAPISEVWDALTNPDKIKKYMFGCEVISNWEEGEEIVWKGEWEGKPFEDKGTLLKVKPNETLMYTHVSPLEAKEGNPEYRHQVTMQLSPKDELTSLTLLQDGNPTVEAAIHSQENWKNILNSLKKVVEEEHQPV